MSNSVCADSKGEQRSSNAAHQQDVRVCLLLSVSAGGGVMGVTDRSLPPLAVPAYYSGIEVTFIGAYQYP